MREIDRIETALAEVKAKIAKLEGDPSDDTTDALDQAYNELVTASDELDNDAKVEEAEKAREAKEAEEEDEDDE